MEIAQQGRPVKPPLGQRPADDKCQPETGNRHPQTQQHENTAQHLCHMKPPMAGLCQAAGQGSVPEGFEPGEKRHPANREP